MFPFEHCIACFGFLSVRKTKTSNKRQKKVQRKPGLQESRTALTKKIRHFSVPYELVLIKNIIYRVSFIMLVISRKYYDVTGRTKSC